MKEPLDIGVLSFSSFFALYFLKSNYKKGDTMNPNFKDFSEKSQAILMELEGRFLKDLESCGELQLFDCYITGASSNRYPFNLKLDSPIFLLVRVKWDTILQNYFYINLYKQTTEEGDPTYIYVFEYNMGNGINQEYTSSGDTPRKVIKNFLNYILSKVSTDGCLLHPTDLFFLAWGFYYYFKPTSHDDHEIRLWKELEAIPNNWIRPLEDLMKILERKNDRVGQHRLWFLMTMIKYIITLNLRRIDVIEEVVFEEDSLQLLADTMREGF